jgi:hypothetical protein
MRLLVCGGRDFGRAKALWLTLDGWHAGKAITCLIDGAAPGADTLAHWWAVRNGIPFERYPADWSLGRRAGYVRNATMLREGRPSAVLAFPGRRGTAMMCDLAIKAGVYTCLWKG